VKRHADGATEEVSGVLEDAGRQAAFVGGSTSGTASGVSTTRAIDGEAPSTTSGTKTSRV
jgi:hypothetical protein